MGFVMSLAKPHRANNDVVSINGMMNFLSTSFVFIIKSLLLYLLFPPILRWRHTDNALERLCKMRVFRKAAVEGDIL